MICVHYIYYYDSLCHVFKQGVDLFIYWPSCCTENRIERVDFNVLQFSAMVTCTYLHHSLIVLKQSPATAI